LFTSTITSPFNNLGTANINIGNITTANVVTANITTANFITTNITTDNILTANITTGNFIRAIINNVSTGNCHINGSLGINNVSTTCKINVTDTSTNDTVLLENTNNSGGSYVLYKNTTVSWKTGVIGQGLNGGNSYIIKPTDNDNASKIQMFSTGEIQIGYNDLSVRNNNRLIVGEIFSGYISFISAGSETGSIFKNNVGGTSYGISSDYRLKFNVKPLEKGIEKVMKLKPINFNFEGYGRQSGYLAHEVAKICPWAVKGEKDEVDKDGKPVYQSLDVKYLVPILNKAIQEQQLLIGDLIKRISKLEKLNS
jgi:Chaperone of endosialidase